MNEETTTGNMSGGTFVSPIKDEVIKRIPMNRIKGQFASYVLGEKSACKGCDLIKSKYSSLGMKKSPKLITCQMCGTEHKVS